VLHRYYEPVRRQAPRRYSTPHGFCRLTRSLSPSAVTDEQYRHLPSHVPCRSRRPGSRRLHAGHHLANQRAPARLHPGTLRRPRFRCRL